MAPKKNELTTAADFMAIYPWEQQPGETHLAFEAFREYMLLGSGVRTIRRVINDGDRNHSTVSGWSSNNDWVDRAKAYDTFQGRKKEAARQEALEEMYQRQAEQAIQVQAGAMHSLRAFVPDGKDAQKEMSVGNALKALELGAKMERTALGEPDRKVEMTSEVAVKAGLSSDGANVIRAQILGVAIKGEIEIGGDDEA